MEKEFAPYQESLELKALGFDEPCFATYDEDRNFELQDFLQTYETFPSHIVAAPTFSQVFRWFREKHNLKSCIMFRTSMEDNKEYYDWLIKGQEVVYRHFNTYEEAELACLRKLIEIVKNTKP
jgi:hypothetical protein